MEKYLDKPTSFENDLSTYGPVLFDGWCGEPTAWGFKILRRLGEDRFNELRKYGSLEYLEADSWALVVKILSRDEAIEEYGAITDEISGPRGGWKSTTFGTKKFISKFLRRK